MVIHISTQENSKSCLLFQWYENVPVYSAKFMIWDLGLRLIGMKTSFMSSGSSMTALPTKVGGQSSSTATIEAISTTSSSTSISLDLTTSSTTSPPNSPTVTIAADPARETSTGAKAGIGVGAVAFASVLVGLVALILYIRKRRSRKTQPETTQTQTGDGKAELSAAPLQSAKIGELDTHLSDTWTSSWRNTNSTAHERSELVGSVGDNNSWRMSELEGSPVRGHNRMASLDSIGSVRSELEGSPVRGHNRVVSHESVVSSLAASPRIGSSGLRRSELSPVGMGIDDAEVVVR